jgi:hypothetical protein
VGLRKGAAVLLDSGNRVVGTSYLYGYGQGALGVFVPGTISTAAGSGIYTVYSNDTTARNGTLYLPSAVMFDGAGDLYIADSLHNVIRKVNAPAPGGAIASGVMETIAGNGSPGYSGDNGPANSATLNDPVGLTIDGAGNLYIADTGNNVIREIIAATGDIKTIAGTGAAGTGSNGPALSATLNAPAGVTVDVNGNVFVADTSNHLIREIAGGQITTVAGNGMTDGSGNGAYSGDRGPATSASLDFPDAVAFDGSGNMYIPDSLNNRVREVNLSSGIITTFAGTGAAAYGGDGGQAIAASLYTPSGLVFDAAGNLYIADKQNERVRKVNRAGIISTSAGNGSGEFAGDGGSATQASIYGPFGLTLDNAGDLLIADSLDMRIREVASTPAIITFQNAVRISQTSSPGVQGLENDGNAMLAISAITPVAEAAVDPAATTCTSSTPLSIDQACNIGAVFAPTGSTVGSVTGNISIEDNATNQPQEIELDGTAAAINSTTVTVTPTPSPATLGHTVNFHVTVISGPSTGTPSGSVQIVADGSLTLGTVSLNSGGQATFGYLQLGLGLHSIVAYYEGDTTHEKGQSSSTPLTVLPPTEITLTSSTANNTAPVGTVVVFTAVFSGEEGGLVPTGNVSFTAGGQSYMEPINLAGSASVSVANLPVGSDPITVNYGGDANNPASSANLIERITQLTSNVQVAASNASPTYGATISLSATVTPLPSGSGPETITFYNSASCDTDQLTSPVTLVIGRATISTSTLPAGTDTICAKYSGDSNDASGAGTVTLLVAKLQPTISLAVSPASPSVAGTSLALTATVTGASTPPAGTVSFTIDGVAPGALVTLNNGMATLNNIALHPGAHTLTASYSGDANNQGTTISSGYASAQASTTTAITPSPDSAVAGNSVTFRAKVQVSAAAQGVNGNGGIPKGTVQFYSGSTLLGTPQSLVAGVASYAVPSFAPGTYALSASFQGDINDAASTSAVDTLSVQKAQSGSSLTSSSPNNTSTVTQSVTFTATVKDEQGTALPTGSVTFTDGSATLGTVSLNNGVAAFATSSLPVGQHSLVASYSGDANNTSSQSAVLSEGVQTITTITSLGTSQSTANTAQQIILAATVLGSTGPVPTGTVTFMSGSTMLGTSTSDATGVATFSPVLNPGTYSVTAVYAGDLLHAGSASSPLTLTITPGVGFDLTPTSMNLSLVSGQNSTMTLSISSNDSFTDQISLGCAALPSGVTCNFSKPNVQLTANGTASVELTIDTASPLSGGTQVSADEKKWPGTLLAGCLLPVSVFFGGIFYRSRRRYASLLATALLMTFASFFVTGCGGIKLNSAAAGTYSFQIVGTGVNTKVTRTVNVTLVVAK